MNKTQFPVDKRHWRPSLIPGPLVLVSTVDYKGSPNVAPKSWVQMVSFEPSILMFSGTEGNTTENNILESKCFGINLVDSAMAGAVYGCLNWHGLERIERLGLQMIPPSQIKAPLVGNCKAHIECRMVETKSIGSGFVVFGQILAASIRQEIMQAECKNRYELLDQVLFLETGLYAAVTDAKAV